MSADVAKVPAGVGAAAADDTPSACCARDAVEQSFGVNLDGWRSATALLGCVGCDSLIVAELIVFAFPMTFSHAEL